MKKLIAILLIAVSINCFGQDTTKLSDTTKFLSIADINRLSQKYQDVATFKEYQSFLNIMNAILKDAVAEWNSKKKKQ